LGLEFRPVEEYLLHVLLEWKRKENTEALRQLAALGLTFFLMAPFPKHLRHSHDNLLVSNIWIYEYTPEGQPIRSFELPWSPAAIQGITVAPSTAPNYGFKEGHFYISMASDRVNPLNPLCILELTPEGEYVRRFTGGASMETWLIRNGTLRFTLDGRLLVSSGDRFLEFTQGGRFVRKFHEMSVWGGPNLDRDGNIYVCGGWLHHKPIWVLKPNGETLRVIEIAPGDKYQSLAVSPRGEIYGNNPITRQIDVFSPQGERLPPFQGIGNLYGHVNFGPHGHFYYQSRMPRTDSPRVVQIHEPLSRRHVKTVAAPPGVEFLYYTVIPNGNLIMAAAPL
jgi:hypothetical protein